MYYVYVYIYIYIYTYVYIYIYIYIHILIMIRIMIIIIIIITGVLPCPEGVSHLHPDVLRPGLPRHHRGDGLSSQAGILLLVTDGIGTPDPSPRNLVSWCL